MNMRLFPTHKEGSAQAMRGTDSGCPGDFGAISLNRLQKGNGVQAIVGDCQFLAFRGSDNTANDGNCKLILSLRNGDFGPKQA